MSRVLQKSWIVILVGLGVVIFFQNCGSYSAIKQQSSPLVYKIGNGQQLSAQSLSLAAKQSVCKQAENWSCEIHHYRPTGPEQIVPSKVCSDGLCVPALVITHDASAVLADCRDCTAADSQSGGRYNYDDVFCSNNMISQQGSRVIEANQPVAEQALAEALSLCLITAESL